jgi:quinolinate synthase
MILKKKISAAKAKHDALILAHVYQPIEIQDAADHVGDSLELARKSAAATNRLIVFCGVHFMAETASILAPDKKVVLPNPAAGCPMADMITAKGLEDLKEEHPDHKVMCYVNSSADVKALSDYCCTSANAVSMMETLPGDRFIFVSDKYLGSYAGRVSGKHVVTADGYCHVHMKFTSENVKRMRKLHPEALLMVHPESPREVVEVADYVGGTGQMGRFAASSNAKEFIVGTEVGMIARLKKLNPAKEFFPLNSEAVCPNMKKISLTLLLKAIETESPVVKVPRPTALLARKAIDEMMKIG